MNSEEHGVLARMDLTLISRLVWPLLFTFIILGFLDTFSTLIAYSVSRRFVELNSFASAFFRKGFAGFMLAEVTKYIPVPSLTYMASLRKIGGPTDYQVGLLKVTALVVLVVADVYLALILVVNNIPTLIGALARPP